MKVKAANKNGGVELSYFRQLTRNEVLERKSELERYIENYDRQLVNITNLKETAIEEIAAINETIGK